LYTLLLRLIQDFDWHSASRGPSAAAELRADIWRLRFRDGSAVSRMRGHSGERDLDARHEHAVPPESRANTWQDSILATSQAISGRWGSDGGVDDWSGDCAEQPNRYRRRMSDTGRISDWSKSAKGSEKLERLSVNLLRVLSSWVAR